MSLNSITLLQSLISKLCLLGSSHNSKILSVNSIVIIDIEIVEVRERIIPKPYNVDDKDTVTTKSGLKYLIVKVGEGAKIKSKSEVVVHYTGYLIDGEIVSTSIEQQNPIAVKLGSGTVIKGWDEGLQLLRVGSKARFIIPSTSRSSS